MSRWKPIRKVAAAIAAAAAVVAIVGGGQLVGIDVASEGREALVAILAAVAPVVAAYMARDGKSSGDA